MPRLLSLVILGLSINPSFAGGPAAKIVLDQWEVAYLGEGKAGYVHTIAKEIDLDGQKVVHTTVELRLTVKRFNDTIQMSMDTGSLETSDGKVVGVFMRQVLAKHQETKMEGTVVDKQLERVINGKTYNPVPWNDEVLGLLKQEHLYKDRELKEGDRFTYQSFEPSINVAK